MPSRRILLAILALSPLLARSGQAQTAPKIVVTRDPNCGCCGGWVDHLRASGFLPDVVESADVNAVKTRLGVPPALYACHTAEIERYAIEGHVPAGAIRRLLAERPKARGLAVAGMPIGSPGMEVEGAAPETYDVVLFGLQGERVFARYRGAEEIKA